ncbi:monomethylamine:corrinoid methyltransferase [Methanococcoides sp. AM1]|uniref:monomethylamine:corrinoid methyltransferase n=1 Tax=Methanococcoides sp. AM1 TaxID=1201011 RepID=UPI0010833A94|nr:monomethylamine:corrinoid methyltransferase [Methanococcoides sp. AM1]
MLDILDIYDRFITADKIEEKNFDNRILPQRLNELAKEYDIEYRPDEIVPQDMDMVDSIFKAAMDLVTDVGVYNINTSSAIKLEESEIKANLRILPGEKKYGIGNDALKVVQRKVGDKRAPVVFGGANGGVISEQYYSKFVESVAKEPLVGGVLCGTVATIHGMELKARSPSEMLGARAEAVWAREGLRMAGRPGMPMQSIMSAVTSEGQIFGDGPGAVRPEDQHLVCLLNDMKVDWDVLKKVVSTTQNNYVVEGCMCPVMGGYTGGPATTAIANVAEGIVSYIMLGGPAYSVCPPFHPMTGEGSSAAPTFVSAYTGAALKRNTKGLYANYVFPLSGMCTEMEIDEIAVYAGAITAAGNDILSGAAATCGTGVDVFSGMDARITAEIGIAAAKMSLADMNEFCVELEKTYADALKSGNVPKGKTFQECYDIEKVRPSKEFEDLWAKSKAKLSDLGMEFEF